MTKTQAYSLFALADSTWRKELSRCFGKTKAHEAQHTKQGRGSPGSNLRVLFDNREAARDQWENLAFGRELSFCA